MFYILALFIKLWNMHKIFKNAKLKTFFPDLADFKQHEVSAGKNWDLKLLIKNSMKKHKILKNTKFLQI